MAEGIEATKAEVWGVDGGCGAGTGQEHSYWAPHRLNVGMGLTPLRDQTES